MTSIILCDELNIQVIRRFVRYFVSKISLQFDVFFYFFMLNECEWRS